MDGRVARKLSRCGQQFYMDFGFLRASTEDYARPNEKNDRVVESFDRYNSYLLIVDEVSRHVWIFLCKSKVPPVEIVSLFLEVFDLKE